MVIVGTGSVAGLVVSAEAVVLIVSSLQPSQPGVLHVELDDVVVVVVSVPVVVVVSSRHPDQPGVLHVAVRVFVLDVLSLLVVLIVEVISLPLLSKYFQLKQSVQSSSRTHSGTASYESMILMTSKILWYSSLCCHFLSFIVSYTHRLPV